MPDLLKPMTPRPPQAFHHHQSPGRLICWRGLFGACLLLFGLPSLTWAEPDTYQLGVFPFFPASDIEKIFSPAVKYLSQAVQQPIRLSTRRTTHLFAQELAKETYDIAFVQPFDYINIASKHGYLPPARVQQKMTRPEGTTTAIIVSLRQPDNDQGIQNLRNKILATPPEDAAVSLLAKLMLHHAALTPGKNVTLLPTRNHKSCLQQLYLQKADACVTVKPIIQNFKNIRNIDLYIVAQSSPIPSSLYVVHQRIPAEVREKLQNTILRWHIDNPETSHILKTIRVQRFMRATDADYDSVRNIWQQLKHVH